MRTQCSVRAYFNTAVASDTLFIIKVNLLFIMRYRFRGTIIPAFSTEFTERVITYRPLHKVPAHKTGGIFGSKDERDHLGEFKTSHFRQVAVNSIFSGGQTLLYGKFVCQ